MAKRVGLLWHALMLGWVDAIVGAVSYLRPVPIEEKVTAVWVRRLMRRFDVRLVELPGAPLLTGRRCLYFFPHRSFSDLFIHKQITAGHGATLSRAGMGVVFPLTWLATRLDRSTWFFRRDKLKGVKIFSSWLDGEFERCPLGGLIVYPEGHRNTGDEPLRLMGGMANYAYSRGLPVQIIMTGRTEKVLDEKNWTYRKGQQVPYRIEPHLDPADFDDRRGFREEIERRFAAAFDEVVRPDVRSDR